MFAVCGRATERGIAARQAVKFEEDRAARLKAQRDAMLARQAENLKIERRREVARQNAAAYAAELKAAGVRYRPSLRSIEAKACRIFGLTLAELHGNRRNRHTVFARHFVMYWAARQTSLSLPQIGRLMGGRDHTTILHGFVVYPGKRAKMGRFVRSLRHARTALETKEGSNA